MSTGCHTGHSSKTPPSTKIWLQHHLPWSHWELVQKADSWAPLAALSLPASRSCFLSQEMLCCLSSSQALSFIWVHSASSWSPICFLWPPTGPPSPLFWLQSCPPGPWQWVISVCTPLTWMLRDGLWLMGSVILIFPEDACRAKAGCSPLGYQRSVTLHSCFYSEGLLGLHQSYKAKSKHFPLCQLFIQLQRFRRCLVRGSGSVKQHLGYFPMFCLLCLPAPIAPQAVEACLHPLHLAFCFAPIPQVCLCLE